MIGHRGVAACAPENTLAGFKLAAQQGIDWIEFDLRLTKDNQLVIFHDALLQRTTNESGWVHDKTLSELITLDAGSWFHPKFQNEKIPSFVHALPLLLSLNLTLNIELKLPQDPSLHHVNTFAKELSNTLHYHWPKELPLPLVSSFYWPILHQLRSAIPTLPLGFLNKTCSPALLLEIAKTPNAACHTHFEALTPEILLFAKEIQVPLLSYTVNDPTIAATLLDQGIFAIFSDDPTKIIQHLQTTYVNIAG